MFTRKTSERSSYTGQTLLITEQTKDLIGLTKNMGDLLSGGGDNDNKVEGERTTRS